MAWRSKNLKLFPLCALFTLETSIAIALIVLIHFSNKNAGFTAVSQTFALSISFDNLSVHRFWNQGFLWTSLPTLLMTIFRLCFSTIVDDLADETPFRELGKNAQSSMKKTILLDYRKTFSFFGWYVAFKNRHITLGFCMLLSVINTLVLVPLAARLFAAVNIKADRDAIFQVETAYNGSKIEANVDYGPILSIIEAVTFHQGVWPLWTNGAFAFPSFDVKATSASGANVTDSSLNTTAYSANLDCELVTDYVVSRINDTEDGAATITVSVTDRGCPVQVKAAAVSGIRVILKTASTIDCSADTGYSRISLFGGTYDASAPYLLDDMTFVSCRPSYSSTPGVLTAPPSLQPLVFEPHLEAAIDNRIATHWISFEQGVINLSNVGDSSSPDFTSVFGNLVLQLTGTENGTKVPSGDVLIPATERMWSSVFAVLGADRLFDPLPTPIQTPGIVRIAETRLQVVSWSAYVSIAIICILMVLTAILIFYLPKHPTILPEEPRGILGAASLLHGSNSINREFLKASQSPGYDGKFYEWLDKTYILGFEQCTIAHNGRGIEVQNLLPRNANRTPEVEEERTGYEAGGGWNQAQRAEYEPGRGYNPVQGGENATGHAWTYAQEARNRGSGAGHAAPRTGEAAQGASRPLLPDGSQG